MRDDGSPSNIKLVREPVVKEKGVKYQNGGWSDMDTHLLNRRLLEQFMAGLSS